LFTFLALSAMKVIVPQVSRSSNACGRMTTYCPMRRCT